MPETGRVRLQDAPFSIAGWFDSRSVLRADFLRRQRLDPAMLSPVGDDCAFRRYFRVPDAAGRSLILMEAVPDGMDIATPGHSLHDFVRIDRALAQAGLHTPRIEAADEKSGYLLLEDFGNRSFKTAMKDGHDLMGLYGLATDVLDRMRTADIGIALPDYYESHVHTGRRRLVDWYLPACTGRMAGDSVAEEYLAVWDRIERDLPPCPKGFLHIDFHFENLMLLDKGQGIGTVGLLDFQGAMNGPVPYDLANLLEDARVDVPKPVRTAMLDRYCRDMEPAERDTFRAWYRVLATQFHSRVLGQFIRLAVRDGKDRYLQHIPRVAGYMRDGLQDPILAPLADWLKKHGLDFSRVDTFDAAAIRPLIRPDAF